MGLPTSRKYLEKAEIKNEEQVILCDFWCKLEHAVMSGD